MKKTKEIEKIKEELKKDNTPLRKFKGYTRDYSRRNLEDLSTDEYDDLVRMYVEVTYERRFLYDADNIQNCENCPHNIECDGWQGRYPCGQWNCWVALHQ